MVRGLQRVIAVLLAASLMADPASAAFLHSSNTVSSTFSRSQTEYFTPQAFNPLSLFFSVKLRFRLRRFPFAGRFLQKHTQPPESLETEGETRVRFDRLVQMARAAEETAPEGDQEKVYPYIAEEGTKVRRGDSVAFLNFRGDRGDPILRLLTWNPNQFTHWVLVVLNLTILPFGNYNDVYLKELGVNPVLNEQPQTHTVGEIWFQARLRQFRIAETEKFKHVTYFFDGLRDMSKKWSGDLFVAIGIKSNDKASGIDNQYERPEMKAKEIADAAIQQMVGDGVPPADVGVINFANSDIIGHSALDQFEAVVTAVQTVDEQVERVWKAVQKVNGIMIVTADHGSSEAMAKLTEKGKLKLHNGKPISNKAHAFDNSVDFMVLGQGAEHLKLKTNGSLRNVAPTILQLQGLDQPTEMDAESLLDETTRGQFKGRPIFLVIRDGQGINKWRDPEKYPEAFQYDAVHQARLRSEGKMLRLDRIAQQAPGVHMELAAHGEYIGHPSYQMGDSENGHRNMAAGRHFDTPITQINKLLEDPDFSKNSDIRKLIDNAKKSGRLHLWGMLSPGGVHSHTDHFLKFMSIVAQESGIQEIILHPDYDGRDTDVPAAESLRLVLDHALELGPEFARKFKVGSSGGRKYRMERDGLGADLAGKDGASSWNSGNRPAYDAMVHGKGRTGDDVLSEAKKSGHNQAPHYLQQAA